MSVFFDTADKLYRIRLDAPFGVAVFGARIGETRQEVLDRLGSPQKALDPHTVPGSAGYIYSFNSGASVRYDFDHSDRLQTIFILAGSLDIPPAAAMVAEPRSHAGSGQQQPSSTQPVEEHPRVAAGLPGSAQLASTHDAPAASPVKINICAVAGGTAVVSDSPCPPNENKAPDLERHRTRMVILCAGPDLLKWLKAQPQPDDEARNAKLRELMDSCRGELDPPAGTSNTDGAGRPYTPGVPPFTLPVEFSKDPKALETPRPLAPNAAASAPVSGRPKGGSYGAERGLVNMDHSATFEEPKAPVIYDLGRLSNGTGGYAAAISADGRLVVGAIGHGNYGVVAFTWTPSSGMVSLDQSVLIRRSGDAAAVNPDGSVIVGSWNSEETGLLRAFRWTRKTGIVTLGILPGADRSNATAVSADGRVVVGQSERAFRWTERTGMVALPGGRTIFGATAVSADGRMAFGEEYGSDGSHVIRWDEDGTITRYAKPIGAYSASVKAVTPDGSIAVGDYSFAFGKSTKTWQTQAAVWYSPTHLVSLGSLHGGKFSKATAVSADGSVVVGDATDGAGDGRRTGFRWTAATGMQSVEEWVRGAGGNPGASSTDEAMGISGDGTRVVGSLKNADPFVAIVSHR